MAKPVYTSAIKNANTIVLGGKMEENYNPNAFESKWQKHWIENKENVVDNKTNKTKYYCLDMFPYPSGSGLHVGHWRGYVLSDVISRYKKLQGYEVLHPMGWDAFGLPAENDAIKKGIHPKINTDKNINNIRRQIQEIGSCIDWTREFSTTDPEYYKWTQWIFVQFYKKGLAYRKEMPINWCPNCKTGLANEEVTQGVCERCGDEVEKRFMKQWMLKITAYADRLLNDLNKLDWPDKVKLMQENWIGRSEGANTTFKAVTPDGSKTIPFDIYTTRPDTLYGATYVVFAPEHPLVKELTDPSRKKEVEKYIEDSLKTKEIDRTAEGREKTGVFLGSFAINPVNGAQIPIYIADYVLLGYGFGAIMAVPAHDQRDFEFAKKFKLPIIEVVQSDEAIRDQNGELAEAYSGEGIMINSTEFDGMTSKECKRKITEKLHKEGVGEFAVNYKLRDWIFARQRYWGEPIPILYCDKCGEMTVPEEDLPVVLPEVESYQPSGTGESPLANIKEWVETKCPKCNGPARRETDTMPQWAGSSWYFLRYITPKEDKYPFTKEDADKWMPVDLYVGGIEHAILHLLYARFFHKFLFDLGLISTDEPFKKLFNQGMVLRYSDKMKKDCKMSKSLGNVVDPDTLVDKYGTDSLRLYELFVGPPEEDSVWNDRSISGIYRFLARLWSKIMQNIDEERETDLAVTKQLHLLIKNATERLETFKLNTVISAYMEFNNYINSQEAENKTINKKDIETLLILLSPLAPHFAEEVWHRMGHKQTIFKEQWPVYDEQYLVQDSFTLAVQINGKMRGTLDNIPINATEDQMLDRVKKETKINKHLEGKSIIKKIYIPKKLLNIIVK